MTARVYYVRTGDVSYLHQIGAFHGSVFIQMEETEFDSGLTVTIGMNVQAPATTPFVEVEEMLIAKATGLLALDRQEVMKAFDRRGEPTGYSRE